jgi:hypothetical protein
MGCLQLKNIPPPQGEGHIGGFLFFISLPKYVKQDYFKIIPL